MKLKELEKLRTVARETIQLRGNIPTKEGIGQHECIECNVTIEEWDEWKRGDLCFECLRRWFNTFTPELIYELVQNQICRVVADREQIELGGEKVCRD